MNIDEVIKILRNEQTCVKTADSCDRDCAKCPLVMGSDEIIEAYEIAIKLLLQLTRTDEVRTQMSSADCISRQAAIDVIDAILPVDPMKNEYTQGITCGAALAIEYVKQLPSAQPSDEYERGWKEGREALREETWEYVRDRFD